MDSDLKLAIDTSTQIPDSFSSLLSKLTIVVSIIYVRLNMEKDKEKSNNKKLSFSRYFAYDFCIYFSTHFFEDDF